MVPQNAQSDGPHPNAAEGKSCWESNRGRGTGDNLMEQSKQLHAQNLLIFSDVSSRKVQNNSRVSWSRQRLHSQRDFPANRAKWENNG